MAAGTAAVAEAGWEAVVPRGGQAGVEPALAAAAERVQRARAVGAAGVGVTVAGPARGEPAADSAGEVVAAESSRPVEQGAEEAEEARSAAAARVAAGELWVEEAAWAAGAASTPCAG